MALQTANQFQLTPNIGQAITSGLQAGSQFASQQQQRQVIGAEQERRQQNVMLKGAANAAVKAQNLPDDKSRINFLKQRVQEVSDRGGDPSDTQEVLGLFESGQVDQANALLDSFVKTSIQTGLIKPLAQGSDASFTLGAGQQRFDAQGNVIATGITAPQVKPTASAQDFQTFQQLNAKALKTQDPIDIQLAEQFGRQSGFDRETPQELADIEVRKESKKTLVKQAATASKEAFDSLKGVRLTIANVDDAIKALDEGAATGTVVSKLPSFRQASIELDNIKGRMGLDVVGATTFGALSESELAFALDVALPTNLEPAALKDWLTRKKETQTKLANELRKAASFLGTPGNTIADYISKQEKENPVVEDLSDDELFN